MRRAGNVIYLDFTPRPIEASDERRAPWVLALLLLADLVVAVLWAVLA